MSDVELTQFAAGLSAQGEEGVKTSLLAQLHRCVCENAAWPVFLRALRAATRADHANVTFRRRDAPLSDVTSFVDADEPSGDLEQRYSSEFHRNDPMPYHGLEAGRLYSLPELVDPDHPASAAYIRAFLNPLGINYLRIVRVTEPAGYTAWLTIARRDSDFGPVEEAFMTDVSKHFEIALRTYSALEASRHLQAVYEAAVTRLNIGVITLDASGRILSADGTALHMIRESGALEHNAGGELLIHPAGPRRILSQALRDFARNPESSSRVIHLGGIPRCDLLLLPIRNRPLSGNRTPVLTAYLHSGCEPANRHETLMHLFGLSLNEARLALALSRGRTLAQAAQEIGLTTESARTYSKRIFQKTGTHRQTELVHLVLTSRLSLA